MAYIEKEPIVEFITKGLNNPDKTKAFGYDAIEILTEIEYTPTADVVEVVRCKDCKRCYEKRTKRNNQLMRFCMRMGGNEYQVNANDFCSYGIPKERCEQK